jgi:GTP cyclohydrolase I
MIKTHDELVNEAKEMILNGLPKETVKEALEKIYPGAMQRIRELLQIIGDDPDREGLIDTPYRVVKSWLEIYGGYKCNNTKLDTSFAEDIGEVDDTQIVMCRNIEFYSTCEHHMIPFHGYCHIGYLPNKKVIGVSKLVRIVEYYAKRLQIQEKLCSQIADYICEILEPQGVGVIITADHLCMKARGVRNANSNMVTSQMRGKFKDQIQTRQEFLSLIKL